MKAPYLYQEQGAGDQVLMFGYATNETPEFMPLSIILANRLTQRLYQRQKKRGKSGTFARMENHR